MNEQLEKLIALGMTEEEAKQVLQDDEEIAHGADLFPLTPEQEKASAQARRAERKKDTKPRERKRKEDADKRELITMIYDLFRDTCVDDDPIKEIKVTNPERQIDFDYHGRKFRVVLSAPRS
jgi:hypothetical protein